MEINNPGISLRVYGENGEILHKRLNTSNNNEFIVKVSNNRYHALKPPENKCTQLKTLLKQFTHKELADFILSKTSYYSFNLMLHSLFSS